MVGIVVLFCWGWVLLFVRVEVEFEMGVCCFGWGKSV